MQNLSPIPSYLDIFLVDPGVPVLRRRHEPGADRRRDPGHVAQGALSRYVCPPPGARARAAPARAPHRAPEPARAAAREPPPRLPPPPSPPHAAHLRDRPLSTADTGLPTATNVTNDTDVANVTNVATTVNAANQTVLRARVSTDRHDTCKEGIYITSSNDTGFVFTCLFLWGIGSDIFVREYESYAVDL